MPIRSTQARPIELARYRLVSIWQLEAPIEAVYRAIRCSTDWPSWWPGAERVIELEAGDASGVGQLQRYTWKGVLPYRLRFDVRVIRVEPLVALAGRATGELEGSGCWLFSQCGSVTTVRYEWDVRTTGRWMNRAAPFARSLIEWNHDTVMRRGARGLARFLGARLIRA